MPRFAANLSTLFNEVPFLDRFAAAAGAGFDAVECQFPYAFGADEIAARLSEIAMLANFWARASDQISTYVQNQL